jgi:fucose permease
MGIITSLVLGRMYDRVGLPVILGAVLVAAFFAPLVFLGGFGTALVGMLLWGVGYATQDTLLKALVAGMLPEGKRSMAFGLFYAGYGVGWLIGSIVTGLLYEHSRGWMIAFAMAAQLLSIPIFLIAARARGGLRGGGA